MYNIELDWKPFKIHVGHFNKVLKSIAGPNYAGISASHEKMIVHFTAAPSSEHHNRVMAEYSQLEALPEALKFDKEIRTKDAIERAKANIIVGDFSAMIPAERKLLMGIALSNEDKDALLEKYPQ